MAKTYRKKPEYIEAVQWTGSNFNEVKEFGGNEIGKYNGCLFINSPGIQGRIESMVVNETDYIVKTVNGRLYSLDKMAFETLYEEYREEKGH